DVPPEVPPRPGGQLELCVAGIEDAEPKTQVAAGKQESRDDGLLQIAADLDVRTALHAVRDRRANDHAEAHGATELAHSGIDATAVWFGKMSGHRGFECERPHALGAERKIDIDRQLQLAQKIEDLFDLVELITELEERLLQFSRTGTLCRPLAADGENLRKTE